ncbi:ABC transporter ATP-binding protein [Acidovorax sp. Leaf160]|uniref:ABC transporter ATP-binding protein n=1 Tax=Acidovorax sp. Leaf160 TaxID=1736280 RepID=UPI0006FDD5A1|nr:ABC transporter ATP-binding protein [Acidovorax sp. Leaf160]KQR63307.1 sugar ABC transporter ATP-binding protein [Acidovorax sp. Leaf160]
MSSDNSIHVERLSKCFQIYEQPRDRLKQFIYPRLRKLVGVEEKKFYREFWALRDINFSIEKGETVGIIGRNGSGKSTLLQIICGTLSATTGEVSKKGRVAALLELGSGFNPEFTGRENVYMNASVLGLNRREIEERFDDIIGFADIGQFIDQPVKTYSSGMVVRLAFAVQSQIEPDILIVDEALSVGDARFQAKCFDRLKKLKDSGTSILLVTHSSEQIVTHCNRALLINDGILIETGEPRRIVNRYLDLLFGREQKLPHQAGGVVAHVNGLTDLDKYPVSSTDDLFSTRPNFNVGEFRWGDGSGRILDFFLSADEELYPSSVMTGQKLILAVSLEFLAHMVRPILGFTVKTKEGVTVYGTNSEMLNVEGFEFIGQKGSTAVAEIKFRCDLAPGDYFVSLGLASREGADVVPHDRRYDSIHLHISHETSFHGLVNLQAKISLS